MENQNTNQSLFDLNINENAKTQLRGAATLAGTAAILSLIASAIGFIRTIMERNAMANEYNRFEGFNQTRISAYSSGSIGGAVISLIIAILLFIFLNRFASQTKSGLSSNNQPLVNNGLGGLSAYFITVGIIVIIVLALILIVIAYGASSPGLVQ